MEIAAYGFEFVELHAVRTHVDFANPAVVADLQQWLAEARLDLQGLHVPVERRFDWPSALTTVQKVGYEGPLIVDPPPRTSTKEMLRLARAARERFEKQLCTFI